MLSLPAAQDREALDSLLSFSYRSPTPPPPTLPQQGAPVEASSGTRKVPHPTPMLSLPAAQEREALDAWAKRLARLGVDAASAAFVIEPKVDGLAVRVVYR